MTVASSTPPTAAGEVVFVLPAGEASPSQHGLSSQMEEAAKEWFTAGPQDKVNFEINLMVAPGPLGEQLALSLLLCCRDHERSQSPHVAKIRHS